MDTIDSLYNDADAKAAMKAAMKAVADPIVQLRMTMHWTLRTRRNKFTLKIQPGYCGAQVSCRYPIPGETWLRGRDLLDSTKLTHLPRVLWDMISYEFGWGRWKS